MSDAELIARGWRRFTDDGPLLPPESDAERARREHAAQVEAYHWHPRRLPRKANFR